MSGRAPGEVCTFSSGTLVKKDPGYLVWESGGAPRCLEAPAHLTLQCQLSQSWYWAGDPTEKAASLRRLVVLSSVSFGFYDGQ